MNHIKFNEPLLTKKETHFEDFSHYREKFLNAPIFFTTQDELNKEEKPEISQINILSTHENFLPFPFIRLFIEIEKGKHIKVWIGQIKSSFGDIAYAYFKTSIQSKKMVATTRDGKVPHPVSDSDDMVFMFSTLDPRVGPEPTETGFYWRACKKDQYVPYDDGMIGRIREKWVQDMAREAFAFLIRLNQQIDFVAMVKPSQQEGKSVEWVRARSHYVLIHKAHPANNREVKVGEKVEVSEKYLKRMAHSRRAHYRILRSPKFRWKAGQKIRVRSCWVGPKEWQENGSIYVLQN